MSEAARDAVILEHVKSLRLPTVGREFPAVSRQARDAGWPYEDHLKELLEREVLARQSRTVERLIKYADFPDMKTLDQIDWKALNGISKPKLLELATCGYIGEGEDVIFAGPIGTGKSHLAIALGIEAARRRHRVVFTRAADLVRNLLEARDDRLLGRLHRRFARASLLIVDELGFVPFSREGGELLFNLLSERYERRSTMITTNLAFSEWGQVFQSEKLTAALLDRISHHAHILTPKGASYRARSRKKTG
jgi:DNA replication protein DnaC